MKIIIAGSGEVGSHLAKLLSYESQEITLIDSNDEKLTFPNSQLDIKVVEGDCTSISILKKAFTSDTDLFVGVTASESVNLLACYLAKQLGAKKTIARISNPELIDNENVNISDLGISELISPEILTSKEINMVINRAEFTWEVFGTFTLFNIKKIIDKSIRLSFRSKGKDIYIGDFLNVDDKKILKDEIKSIIEDLNLKAY